MRNTIRAILLLCSFALLVSACHPKSNAFHIPEDGFNIPVKIIHTSSGFGGTAFYSIRYKAVFRSSLVNAKYIFKNRQDSLLEIQYSGMRFQTLILVKYLSPDSGSACIIRWIDGPAPGKVIATDTAYPIEIGAATTYVETSLKPSLVRSIYPVLKCKISQKEFKEIVLDAYKPVTDLEFFDSIKLVE